jgi:hypothetical protein
MPCSGFLGFVLWWGKKAKRLESGFLVTESKNPDSYGLDFILVFCRSFFINYSAFLLPVF